jgi:hypothetical protein
MVVVTSRVARSIKNSPTLSEDALDVYEEMNKLVIYYRNEIKISNIELKRMPPSEREAIANLKGLCEAYQDHVVEIEYIQNMLRGHHHDKEGDKV